MKLERKLIVFDLETTGTWIEKDKIVEIAMIKMEPNGNQETYLKRVNPGIPIPPEVSEIIGITDEDVKNAPPFREIAGEVLEFLEEADLGGYNHERFDLPILKREFAEAKINFDWEGRRLFDAQRIFHYHEKRDLTAAYKYYCKKDLKNAHSALADTEATLAILESQIEKYGNGDATPENLFKVIEEDKINRKDNYYDKEGKFRWWNGELYPVFGKYAKKWSLREIAAKDSNYLNWIVNADFSPEIKQLAKDAINKIFP